MRVAVIGAGIVGITTAYELTSDGHEVTVFERGNAAAQESSFANAGVVAPGYVTPWAAPGMPLKVLTHLLQRHAPVRLGWPSSKTQWAWMWQWWRACNTETYLTNRAHMQRLAFYSKARLLQLGQQLQLDYERTDGMMVLLRTQKDQHLIQPGLRLLREANVHFQEITADQARHIEPALNPDTNFFGAIYLPDELIGNCRQFALILKKHAQHLGAVFEFNRTISRIQPGQPIKLSLSNRDEAKEFDAVVLCAGVGSRDLLLPIGLRIPLVAVHGYSITAHIREPLNAPRSAVMDERYKVAISRMGQRVRVAGSAELGGSLKTVRASSIQTLHKVLNDWFPGAAMTSQGLQQWKGARPMLPDGPPVLGYSGLSGLWLNLGHGSSGWALSCGSARLLADLISERDPAIDLEGLGVMRLQRK